MRWLIPLLITAALLPNLHAMGKKPEPNRLTFHMQGQKAEGPKMIFPQAVYGKQVYFRRSPEISTKDLIAFDPFFADDGTAGATFSLSKVAQQRFAAITTQNQKSWFIAMFNGRPLDAVLVDRPVTDGKVVVWQGMQRDEIARFDLMIPRIGDTKDQWKTRKEVVKEKMKAKAKKAKK